MATITKKDIEKITKLARIEVDPAKKELLASQLNSTLEWVETLNEVKTNEIPALSSVHNISLTFAKDEVSDGNITEQVLKNAPSPKYNYFTVPKVIE